jgi:hypothetical protein
MMSAKEKYRARRAKKMPSEEMQRLGDRAEQHGCDLCGTRFGVGLPYVYSRTTRGCLSVRCTQCAAVDAHSVMAGASFGGLDPWAEDDRRFFAAHPKRRWRLREPYPGEIAATEAEAQRGELQFEAGTAVVVVHQIESGARLRIFGAVETSDPVDSFTEAGIKNPCRSSIAEIKQLTASVDITDAAAAANQKRHDRRFDIRVKAAKGGS